MRPDSLELYRLMLTSRRLEEEIARLWHDGHISGEMHLGVGEEGIVGGVVSHLGEGDAIAADHRSTPPMVMRGVDLAGIVAECLGSTSGLGRGLGGHMHLLSRSHLAASSGIVGAAGPLACGFALAHQHLRPDRVAVAFFGEGAVNQGMLMESLNLAGCWRLPVLFVCKDNGMAITTPSDRVTFGRVSDRLRAFSLPVSTVNGADAEEVWHAAGEAITRLRGGGGPACLYATCVRPEGHFLGDPLVRIVRRPAGELKGRIGPLTRAAVSPRGAGLGGRAASLAGIAGMLGRAATMRGSDPVRRQRARLEADPEALEVVEGRVEETVRAAVAAALESLNETPA